MRRIPLQYVAPRRFRGLDEMLAGALRSVGFDPFRGPGVTIAETVERVALLVFSMDRADLVGISDEECVAFGRGIAATIASLSHQAALRIALHFMIRENGLVRWHYFVPDSAVEGASRSMLREVANLSADTPRDRLWVRGRWSRYAEFEVATEEATDQEDVAVMTTRFLRASVSWANHFGRPMVFSSKNNRDALIELPTRDAEQLGPVLELLTEALGPESIISFTESDQLLVTSVLDQND